MAKKKKATQSSEINIEALAIPTSQSSITSNTSKDKNVLMISRNKHIKFISAFHGPWLQLPNEILETLAHSNYLSPRPCQTDPSVLYDLLKIRRLVDEASDLAVRAQNGISSSATNSDNGFPGGAYGLNSRGHGAGAKLSPERKYRMRELATQKLSQAYRLDEIAASVATMQSASTLDAVASLVLQRTPASADAKYVHFFHEKIPSRMMAESTSLDALNDVIAYEPGHAAAYRTRAITRSFKEDHLGAIQDLTEALTLCRHDRARHDTFKSQLTTMKTVRNEVEKRRIWTRDWMQENKVADDDQPKGLELQLLFKRGNEYLTVACQYIRKALEDFRRAQKLEIASSTTEPQIESQGQALNSSAAMEAYQRALEARESVRKYAKRALRDYTGFCSQLDYAHASTNMWEESIFRRDGFADDHDLMSSSQSQALTRSRGMKNGQHEPTIKPQEDLVSPLVHDMSSILSAAPPADLPPFPPTISTELSKARLSPKDSPHNNEEQEMITYHPLLPETLHSLLLSHCLLQTPPTTLHRVANNVARLARLADGYPFFLCARSPARADWAEILRKSDNWISLSGSWDVLCKAPTTDSNPLPPEHKLAPHKPSPPVLRKDQIHKEAVLEALGDERVVDDASFAKAVSVRERRAWSDLDDDCEKHWGTTRDTMAAHAASGPRSAAEPIGRGRTQVAKDEEYLIGTERADAIAKWVLEAPATVEGGAGQTKKKKKKRAKRGPALEHSGDGEVGL